MRSLDNLKRRGSTRSALTVVGILVTALLAGCAGPRGAGLDRSQEVWRAFMDGEVMPGYRYYTTGVENAPDAILGMKNDHTLVTERWKERQMTTEAMKQMVGMMNDKFVSTTSGLLGSWVLNDSGERIGIWYSPIGLTTVEMLGEKKVRVNPPAPEAIRRFEERTRGK